MKRENKTYIAKTAKTKPKKIKYLIEYQIAAMRTLPPDGQQHLIISDCATHVLPDEKLLHLLHAALGAAGEAGELVEHVKKAIFYGKTCSAHELKLEAGDLLWYIAAPFCAALGCTFAELCNMNIEKLKTRYPDKFTTQHAIERVDVKK